MIMDNWIWMLDCWFGMSPWCSFHTCLLLRGFCCCARENCAGGKREELVVDWGEDDVATQLWVSASTKGGSQHLEFGDLDWIGAKAVAMQLLVRTSTQGGSQRQEFGGVDWIGLAKMARSSWSALPQRVEVSARSLDEWYSLFCLCMCTACGWCHESPDSWRILPSNFLLSYQNWR